MIAISAEIHLYESEINYEFTRAGGPGGQHVNKTATAVQLRFDAANSPSLPKRVKDRLLKQAKKRINDEGILVIDARQYRSQQRNKEAALARLIKLIQTAEEQPKKRRKTKPSKAAKQRRLDAKKQRGKTKANRTPIRPSDY